MRGRLGREALGTGGSFVLWGLVVLGGAFGWDCIWIRRWTFCGLVWFWIVLWITELVLGCELCLADLQRSIFLGWLRNSEWCESVGGGIEC